jgi:thiazole synthase
VKTRSPPPGWDASRWRSSWSLEVIGDSAHALPRRRGHPEAARILVQEGFTVLPYVTDDPVASEAGRAGCAAVMPR